MEPMKQRCNWWKMAGILLIVFLALWHGLEVKAGQQHPEINIFWLLMESW